MDKCECLNYVVKNCFIFTDSFVAGSAKLSFNFIQRKDRSDGFTYC